MTISQRPGNREFDEGHGWKGTSMCILSLLPQEAMCLIQLGSVSARQVVGIGPLVRVRYVVDYPNGYGVSIVKNVFSNGVAQSYGARDDLWELAVMKDGSCCYDTPITDDVCGFLTVDEVVALAKEVKELPSADSAEDFSCLFSDIICLWQIILLQHQRQRKLVYKFLRKSALASQLSYAVSYVPSALKQSGASTKLY